MNLNHGIAAVPIQAVAPTKRKAKKWAEKCKKKPSAANKSKSNTKYSPNVKEKHNMRAEEEARFDFSAVPAPMCSCSGVSRRCYKCGSGGWQSSCCTNLLSEFPLPFSPSKPRKRVSGRKMRGGAYRRLLCRLAVQGQDLSRPVDLKNHWAKLGTNKFATTK